MTDKPGTIVAISRGDAKCLHCAITYAIAQWLCTSSSHAPGSIPTIDATVVIANLALVISDFVGMQPDAAEREMLKLFVRVRLDAGLSQRDAAVHHAAHAGVSTRQ